MTRNRFHFAITNKINAIAVQSQISHPPLVKNKADKSQNAVRQIIFASGNTMQVGCFLGETN